METLLIADLIEENGIKPLVENLAFLGGWPVVEGDSWSATNFSITDTLYKIRSLGFSAASVFTLQVVTDLKNNSWRVIEVR